MTLATSPLIQNLLLEDPWPLGLMLIVIACVLLFLSSQRGDKKLLRLAGLAALLAIALFVISSMIETTREHIISQTEKLIAHTAPLDVAAFKALVSPRVIVTVGDDSSAPTLTGEEVFTRLEKSVQSYPIKEQSIIEIDAELRPGDFAICQFDVRSDGHGGRVMTRWLLTWQQQPTGDWLVTQVQWLDCPGIIGLKPGVQWLR